MQFIIPFIISLFSFINIGDEIQKDSVQEIEQQDPYPFHPVEREGS